MRDLEQRLRADGDDWAEGHPSKTLAYEAADRIKELEAEVARLQGVVDTMSSLDSAICIRELEAQVERLKAGWDEADVRADAFNERALRAEAEVARLQAIVDFPKPLAWRAELEAAASGERAMTLEAAIAFLVKAAIYFEKRPTGGEDRAHWSNVYNAENCRKIAAEIARLKERPPS